MKKFLLILALALPVSMLTPACSTAPSQRVATYQTLATVGISAKASIDAAGVLLAQGAISVSQFQKVAVVYDTKFQPAYAVAVGAANKDLSSIASPDLANLALELAALVAQLTIK